jgi:hypothetical protein
VRKAEEMKSKQIGSKRDCAATSTDEASFSTAKARSPSVRERSQGRFTASVCRKKSKRMVPLFTTRPTARVTAC